MPRLRRELPAYSRGIQEGAQRLVAEFIDEAVYVDLLPLPRWCLSVPRLAGSNITTIAPYGS